MRYYPLVVVIPPPIRDIYTPFASATAPIFNKCAEAPVLDCLGLQRRDTRKPQSHLIFFSPPYLPLGSLGAL